MSLNPDDLLRELEGEDLHLAAQQATLRVPRACAFLELVVAMRRGVALEGLMLYVFQAVSSGVELASLELPPEVIAQANAQLEAALAEAPDDALDKLKALTAQLTQQYAITREAATEATELLLARAREIEGGGPGVRL